MSTARPPPPPKPGKVKVVKALYAYTAQAADELSFDEGDILYLEDSSNKDWFSARCGSKVGLIPSNYVQEQTEAIPQPMHSACQYGNFSHLTELIENKVSVNGLDAAGNTPLHWASRGGHFVCVQTLLDSGCEVNVQNKAGDTALHLAAWRSHPRVVNELLSNQRCKADPLVKNRRGQTPLDLATEPEVRDLLIRAASAGLNFPCRGYSDSDDEDDEDAWED